MFKPTNEETSPREYKKPSAMPLFANIDEKKFETLKEKSLPKEFSSKLVEKNLTKNKTKANDSLCGLAPVNFEPPKETPETLKDDSSAPAQEAKTEDNKEETKETPETVKDDSSAPAQEAKTEDNNEETKETPETDVLNDKYEGLIEDKKSNES